MWQADPSQIVAAIILDLFVGDPRGWPHIARLTGKLSVRYEAIVTQGRERSVTLGVVFWGLVTGTLFALYAISYYLCAMIGSGATWLLNTLIIYQAIAAMDLYRHVQAVLKPLASGDLVEARNRLARIVGRDTVTLAEPEISRAAIESVAESLTDGIIGPLFWSVIAGGPGALVYRTANTLDSMVGHRTDAYEKFGKASAKIDDWLNWVPARICALLFCLFHLARRWNVIRREAAAHTSPNAGWSESAMAYALGVRLGGDNYYDGRRVRGPIFNPSGRIAETADIARSLNWMWRIAGACACLLLLVSFCLNYLHLR
ncbi:MAG TPA: adenosylcobinamide-phosphate synthase CbiB [Chthoniobacterales bacterium]|jgi:adenosylcobinamide-phosphate synthase|nr:adenosylcobinamide-phosphate synthase CbiB [Chthoniobacterales bacterium]